MEKIHMRRTDDSVNLGRSKDAMTSWVLLHKHNAHCYQRSGDQHFRTKAFPNRVLKNCGFTHPEILYPSISLILFDNVAIKDHSAELLFLYYENGIKTAFASKLVKDLFSDHQKYIRPVYNRSSVVTVVHRMTPIQILNVDEQNQVISMKTWMSQIWNDAFLSWDPDDYGGVDELQVPITEVWQPDITLVNSVRPGFQRHYDTDAIISFDGTITALQPDVLEATCKIDPRYFPFDQQYCAFKFASWSYPGDKINLVMDPNTNIKLFVVNGEWELLGMPKTREEEQDPCCTVPFPKLIYTMHLRRRSTFYVFNIILPSFLASTLVAVAFYLPSDSGERVTLWVTSILSQFVFLNVVSEFMPPNSEHLPFLQRYFFASIGLVAASSFVIAWSLSMHFRGPHCEEVPTWLSTLVFECLAPVVCQTKRAKPFLQRKSRKNLKTKSSTTKIREEVEMNCTSYNQGFVHENGQSSVTRFNKIPNGVFIVDGSVHQNGQRTHRDSLEMGIFTESEEDGKDDDNYVSEEVERRRLNKWRAISRIIDRVYLLLYLTILIGLLLGFMLSLYIRNLDFPEYEEN
ncbi:neuronal acetylcholine receptor subunit alpha-10-like [Saccoglossus kowalevskii]|uniref:Neuronal acetylcholine receptor subunit alpha-9-I-like n=1 Tax=Saccoglossus kowalevskii TaxID=10224 RepID=A0ABM0GY95_SACKO|nr:PREDICTED: neuronal acetylcholine receptor subunit alpha-9-I-like [Saccoglossus kowalevskii]